MCLSSGTATGYGLDRQEFDSEQGQEIVLFPAANETRIGAHPISYPVGNEVCFPGAMVGGLQSRPLTSI
jgi:hypothetical protein